MVFTVLVFISILNKQDVHSIYLENQLKLRNHIDVNNHLTTDELYKLKSFLKSFGIGVSWPINKSFVKDPSQVCGTSRTCFECVKGSTCGWCHNYGCTESPEKLCPLAQEKPVATSVIDKNNICPYIEHNGPLIIPSGIKTNIKLKVHVLDPVINDKEIICQITLGDRLTHLKGQLIGDALHCYPVTLYTSEYTDTDGGTLNLLWGGAYPYSNDIPIKVFKCESMANECESCRSVPPEYGCGWCNDTESCVVSEKCGNNMMWTLSRQSCESSGKLMHFV